jgi:hypothetical protein
MDNKPKKDHAWVRLNHPTGLSGKKKYVELSVSVGHSETIVKLSLEDLGRLMTGHMVTSSVRVREHDPDERRF